MKLLEADYIPTTDRTRALAEEVAGADKDKAIGNFYEFLLTDEDYLMLLLKYTVEMHDLYTVTDYEPPRLYSNWKKKTT